MFDIVCTMEAGTAGEWQAALLRYSILRANQDSRFIVLCAGGGPSEDLGDDVVVTASYRDRGGGDYAPLNRPYGIGEWLSRNPSTRNSLLILDADVVLFRALPGWSATPGHPCGQFFHDMPGMLRESGVRGLTEHPELLAPVGIPLLITRGDLEALTPGWIEDTLTLRRYGLLANRWVPEMVGYCTAAASCGLEHQVMEVACGPLLFHYYHRNCGLQWMKAQYRPWEPVLDAPPSAAPVIQAFGQLLNEYAALRRG